MINAFFEFFFILFIIFKEANTCVFLIYFNNIYTFYQSYDFLVFQFILILIIVFKKAKICVFIKLYLFFLYILLKKMIKGFFNLI